MGNSTVVTVPRDVARLWESSRVTVVVMELHEGALRIRPLSDDELLRHPAPEEEVPLRGSVPDAER